jgi:hypothetical protein
MQQMASQGERESKSLWRNQDHYFITTSFVGKNPPVRPNLFLETSINPFMRVDMTHSPP